MIIKKEKIFKKYKILGSWSEFKNKDIFVFNSVAKNYKLRNESYKKLNKLNYKFINLVHPSVSLSFSK